MIPKQANPDSTRTFVIGNGALKKAHEIGSAFRADVAVQVEEDLAVFHVQSPSSALPNASVRLVVTGCSHPLPVKSDRVKALAQTREIPHLDEAIDGCCGQPPVVVAEGKVQERVLIGVRKRGQDFAGGNLDELNLVHRVCERYHRTVIRKGGRPGYRFVV